MPESVTDRPTSSYEMVFLLAKSERYFWDAEAVKEPNSNPALAECVKHWTERPGNGEWPSGTGGRMGSVNNGRNIRNVWTIATTPYIGAHFATMPPELAERCIKAGTSERGCCPMCGAAWARVVSEPIVSGSRDKGGTVGLADAGMYSGRAGNSVRGTLGWLPPCSCPSHDPAPCTVLDPFGGAGTTGLVADRLGRHAVLIELNPEYGKMAAERITDDSPLFANVAA